MIQIEKLKQEIRFENLKKRDSIKQGDDINLMMPYITQNNHLFLTKLVLMFAAYSYLVFCFEGLHLLYELLGQLFDLLVVVHVLQSELIFILHLEFINSGLQLRHHGILEMHTKVES